MRKFRYLWVSSRIPKRNFHKPAQNNGVKQQGEQFRKPSSQQGILKKAERCTCRCCIAKWPAIKFIWALLLVTLPHMNNIISISMHKELQSCQRLWSSLLLPWKCYYKTREPDDLQHELYAVHLHRVLWELDILSLPSFFMNCCLYESIQLLVRVLWKI